MRQHIKKKRKEKKKKLKIFQVIGVEMKGREDKLYGRTLEEGENNRSLK